MSRASAAGRLPDTPAHKEAITETLHHNSTKVPADQAVPVSDAIVQLGRLIGAGGG